MNRYMEALIRHDCEAKVIFEVILDRFSRKAARVFHLEAKKRMQLCIAILLDDYENQSSSHQLYIPDRYFESVKEALPERDPSNARITVYVNPTCADKAEEIERNGMQVRVLEQPHDLPFFSISNFHTFFSTSHHSSHHSSEESRMPVSILPPLWFIEVALTSFSTEESHRLPYKKTIKHAVMVAPGVGLCLANIHRRDAGYHDSLDAFEGRFETFFKESVPLREWQKNKVITKQNIPFPNNAEQGRGARED